MVSTGPAGKILLFVTDFTINHAVITCSDIAVERCVGEGEGGQYHSHAVVLLQGGVSLYHAQGEAEGALFPLGRLDGQECLHGDAGVTPAGALQLVHVTQVADRPLLRREARHPAESIKLNSRIQISMFVLFLHLTL